jgi:hypothetical protein
VRGLQLGITWCTTITKGVMNTITEGFQIQKCRNLSELTMVCPTFQSFASFKNDAQTKYGEIKGI